MASVRRAEERDIPMLVQLGRVMHGESRYCEVSYSAERASEHFRGLMASERGLVLVTERDGAVVGFFTGGCVPAYFSDELMAFDFALFILPGHRGGIRAASLVKAFLAWASERKASFVDIGISTCVDVERTGALYERLGLRHVGALYSTMGR